MHGPTGRAGGVASLEGIKYPSKVARMVLQRTDHVLLVGEGAQTICRHAWVSHRKFAHRGGAPGVGQMA